MKYYQVFLANGSYTIDNVPNGATLTASMIGYEKTSKAASNLPDSSSWKRYVESTIRVGADAIA